jgi:hypothetical protein
MVVFGVQTESLMWSHQVTGLWVCLDLLSTRLVGGLAEWGKTDSSWRELRAVFCRWQLCCSSAAALFGQLLPQHFWMLHSVPEISSVIHLLPCFGGLACRPAPAYSFCCFMAHHWEFSTESLVLCHTPESSAVRDHLFAPPPFSSAGSAFHPHLQCGC